MLDYNQQQTILIYKKGMYRYVGRKNDPQIG